MVTVAVRIRINENKITEITIISISKSNISTQINYNAN